MRHHVLFVSFFAVALVSAPIEPSQRAIDRSDTSGKSARVRGAEETRNAAGTFSALTRRIPTESRAPGSLPLSRAHDRLAAAFGKKGDEAIATLNEILRLDLPNSPETDKLLTGVYRRLGDLYEEQPSKQVLLYGMALRHAAEPGMRARLESRIAGLGGDLFAISFGGNAGPAGSGTLDAGPDDTCPGASATGLDEGAPYSEVMDIFPAGDHNWRSFDAPGPEGWFVRIETISDQPGTFSDDTDLALWSDCPENGGDRLAFSDDKPGDFTSLIETDCLHPGSYYVEVGGFFDTATPDDFALEMEVTDTCVIPVSDRFEPDNSKSEAIAIGLPTSVPSHAQGWGRARREIQAHTLFPGGDTDYVKLALTRNSLVRIGTAGSFPTVFNDFIRSEPEDNPDTRITVFYENGPDFPGLCNVVGFLPACLADEECPPEAFDDPMIPGFPPCIPFELHVICDPGPCSWQFEGVRFATNDDRGADDPGSELLLCLPRTAAGSDSASVDGDWVIKVEAGQPGLLLPYEIQVRNEAPCRFELEPNNDFPDATPLPFGEAIHGIYDRNVVYPFADADLYVWDVERESRVTFETDGYDELRVDTALELLVGPDDQGEFFSTGITDDDGGPGFLSRLDLILPPAEELLGNTTADADYYLNVTSFFQRFNYPYTLRGEIAEPPAVEDEPNDDCASAAPLEAGVPVVASVDPACDYDAFKFTLTEDTFVEIVTPAGGDAAILLRDCSDDSVLACDDDSGPGLLPRIDGCLPPGDYCATVRAFSGAAVFDYQLELTGTAGCAATDPPSLSGDGAFTCLDFDACP